MDMSSELYERMLVAEAEVERLTTELAVLRTALTKWDFTGPEIRTSNRDKLVDHLAAHYHIDRPYPTVDHIIEVLAEQWEKTDSILYAVIPEDHWGLRAGEVT